MDTPWDLASLRQAARRAGFEWSDEELQAILPAVEAMRLLFEALEAVPVAAVEPATRYTAL